MSADSTSKKDVLDRYQVDRPVMPPERMTALRQRSMGSMSLEMGSISKRKYPISYAYQSWVLLQRSFLQQQSDIFTFLNFFQAFVVSILVGFFYFQLPRDVSQLQDRFGLVRIDSCCVIYTGLTLSFSCSS